MRDFVGIDLSRESVPDDTTLLKFRRLLLANDLTKTLFAEINAHLAEKGLLMRAANVNDVTQAGALLHGQETSAYGDAGYRGADKRPEAQGPTWFIAMQPGKRRALDRKKKWARLLDKAEQLKASVRAKVEHPYHVVKNLFRHRKLRYKGMAKNQGQ
jgi:IS5 family transposase